jgi:hypothetical protein
MINLFVSHQSQTTGNIQKQHLLYPVPILIGMYDIVCSHHLCVKFWKNKLYQISLSLSALRTVPSTASSSGRGGNALGFPNFIVSRGAREPSQILKS